MALVNCNECSREISTKASACPGCGAPVATAVAAQPPGAPLAFCGRCGRQVASKGALCSACPGRTSSGFFGKLLIGICLVVGGLFVFGWLVTAFEGSNSSSTASSGASYSSSGPALAIPEPPPLEVQSWSCDTEHGYMFVRGEVKNISSRKLENVMAVGEFRTKSGELVKAEDALIEYNPIMPGQTSPFKAGGTQNPQMERCGLAFKYLFGAAIEVTVKDKKQPARPRGRQF